jgi:two-component system NarL family response regulator
MLRVLLIDDHELMRQGLRSILDREDDVEVVGEAASGRAALELSRTLAPDVVVMDVAMQDQNGIEATRQIRAACPNVKVLALSSHSDARYVNAMLEAGACGYVLKANAYDDLRRALDAARRGRSYLCADVTQSVVGASLRAVGATPAAQLSGREREVLQLLAEGLSSPEIGQRLFIATSTVETHRRNIMRRLGIHSVADLTKYAIREGLTSLDRRNQGQPNPGIGHPLVLSSFFPGCFPSFICVLFLANAGGCSPAEKHHARNPVDRVDPDEASAKGTRGAVGGVDVGAEGAPARARLRLGQGRRRLVEPPAR